MVKIDKIVLKIGDKEIELTAEGAKELKEVLDKFFGDPKVVCYYYPNYYHAWTPTYSPTWTYTSTSGNTSLSGGLTPESSSY